MVLTFRKTNARAFRRGFNGLLSNDFAWIPLKIYVRFFFFLKFSAGKMWPGVLTDTIVGKTESRNHVLD